MSDWKRACINRVIKDIKQTSVDDTITTDSVHMLAVCLNVDTIWIRDLFRSNSIIEVEYDKEKK